MVESVWTNKIFFLNGEFETCKKYIKIWKGMIILTELSSLYHTFALYWGHFLAVVQLAQSSSVWLALFWTH